MSSQNHHHKIRKHLTSSAFKASLTEHMQEWCLDFSNRKIHEVFPKAWGRSLIEEFDWNWLKQPHVQAILSEQFFWSLSEIKKTQNACTDFINTDVQAQMKSFLKEDFRFSKQTDALFTRIMHQPLIRDLFVEVVHLAIVAFYKKINPLFGGLAMRAVEKQVKGFISIFMGMAIERATAFVINRQNQAMVSNFIRSLILLLLEEKLSLYGQMVSTKQGDKMEKFLRALCADQDLVNHLRSYALRFYDDFYVRIADDSLGHYLDLRAFVPWWSEQVVELILPWLSEESCVNFLSQELSKISPGGLSA